MANPKKFSQELTEWIKNDSNKTIRDLESVFAEKAFAIAIFLLMALPALPIPTGGISHLFEAIAIFIAIGLLYDPTRIFLPKRWEKVRISGNFQDKGLMKLVSLIKFFERYSKPRSAKLVTSRPFLRLLSLIIILFTVSAFLSPPFSGLDTLPALGVVIICLSIILEDVYLSILGFIVGSLGILIALTLGATIFKFVTSLI